MKTAPNLISAIATTNNNSKITPIKIATIQIGLELEDSGLRTEKRCVNNSTKQNESLKNKHLSKNFSRFSNALTNVNIVILFPYRKSAARQTCLVLLHWVARVFRSPKN